MKKLREFLVLPQFPELPNVGLATARQASASFVLYQSPLCCTKAAQMGFCRYASLRLPEKPAGVS